MSVPTSTSAAVLAPSQPIDPDTAIPVQGPDLSTPLSRFADVVKTNEWPESFGAGLIGSCTNSSYTDMTRAESLVKQFSAEGLEAFVEKISLPGGQTIYRVRVGPYAEHLEAQEIAQEIVTKTGLRPLILPAPAQPNTDDPS